MSTFFPNEKIVRHCHPGLDVLQVRLSGSSPKQIGSINGTAEWGTEHYLKSGEWHGFAEFQSVEIDRSQGLAIYVFQKWPENVRLTSASVAWRGSTAGPKHDALINSYYPGVVSNGVSKFTKFDHTSNTVDP